MAVSRSKTYESAVRAGIPLVAASVALLVVVAGALGGIREDLVAGLPVVADTPASTANRRRPPVRNAGSGLVEVGIGPEYQSLCLDAAVEVGKREQLTFQRPGGEGQRQSTAFWIFREALEVG